MNEEFYGEYDLYYLNHDHSKEPNNQDDLKYLSYLRGNNPLSEMLKTEDYNIVCFVNPPSLDDVFNIAGKGEVMPQKSTFFFPKVFSGLVTRCF